MVRMENESFGQTYFRGVCAGMAGLVVIIVLFRIDPIGRLIPDGDLQGSVRQLADPAAFVGTTICFFKKIKSVWLMTITLSSSILAIALLNYVKPLVDAVSTQERH
jgi:hypothetical protein